jgi:hypothetical protein
MREQLEVIIYQYKKQHNLDVYSPLNSIQMGELLTGLLETIRRIEYKVGVKYGQEAANK